MKAGKPSRTAEFMALFRALESSRPNDRLFEDPFAALFLRPSLRLVVHVSKAPILGSLVSGVMDLAWPGARSSGIARTRLIDDLLGSALEEGVEQVVILGAGFDCRAYRVRGIDRGRVFEVDHPDTLAEKQRRLLWVLSSIPRHVWFVASDFNQQGLERAMVAAGYGLARSTCFIWEGVTNYLTESAIDVAFRWFAAAAPGSHVIFTYVDRRVLTDPAAFEGTKRLLRTMRRVGEPWTFGFDPVEVPAYLAARGLELVGDVGATEYRARYLARRTAGMRGYEFYRVAHARVAG